MSAADSADEAADLKAAVSELLALVDSATPEFRSSLEQADRQYGAAALVQGCELLRAALALEEEGFAGVGLLARAAFEAWLVGAYALLGKGQAVLRLEAELLRQEGTITQRNDLQVTELLQERAEALDSAERNRLAALGTPATADVDIRFARLSIEGIALQLGPMIEAATGEPADARAAYDLFYRGHSAYDAHGVGALHTYLIVDEDGMTIGSPTPWIEAHKAIACAAMYLSLLTSWVFEAFDLPVDDVQHLQDRLVERTTEAAETAQAWAREQGLPGFD